MEEASVHRGSLSRRFLSRWSVHRGFFVQGGIWGSLSRGGVSLEDGVSVQGRGFLSRLGDLCPGEGVSVQGKGSLFRVGDLCSGISVQGEGLCPGREGLCSSLSRERGLCSGEGSLFKGGGLCSEERSLFRGSLSR